MDIIAARTVDEYFERVPPKQKALLTWLRRTIKQAAPEAEEVISYKMPAFKQDGMLVYYAAFTDHCSFFPGSAMRWPEFAKQIKPFLSGKSTLRFTAEHRIPASLVRKIVKARLKENAARAAARKRK